MPESVVIVGGGPCGLALACALGVQGIPFVPVERRALGQWGVALGTTRMLRGVRRYGQGGAVEIPVEPGLVSLSLAAAEAALRDRARAFPGGAIRHEAEMVRIQQDAREVVVDVRRGTRMEVDLLRCAWLAACDGRHSAARRRLRLGADEAPEERTFVVADVRRHGSADDVMVVFDGPLAAARIPGLGTDERWVLELGPDEDGQTLAHPAALVERIRSVTFSAERSGAQAREVDVPELLSFRYFTMHDRIGRRWREGRAFLAGDAAHALNPTWNRGLSLAVTDAAALALHLGRLLRQPAADASTYERERHGAVLAEIEAGAPPLDLEVPQTT